MKAVRVAPKSTRASNGRVGGFVAGNRSVWPWELQLELRWWLEKLLKFVPLRWFTLRALPT